MLAFCAAPHIADRRSLRRFDASWVRATRHRGYPLPMSVYRDVICSCAFSIRVFPWSQCLNSCGLLTAGQPWVRRESAYFSPLGDVQAAMLLLHDTTGRTLMMIAPATRWGWPVGQFLDWLCHSCDGTEGLAEPLEVPANGCTHLVDGWKDGWRRCECYRRRVCVQRCLFWRAPVVRWLTIVVRWWGSVCWGEMVMWWKEMYAGTKASIS